MRHSRASRVDAPECQTYHKWMTTRVTVTLPEELLAELDQQAENRSLFVEEAIRAELNKRRRERLVHAIQRPHPESVEMADSGFTEWVAMAAEEDSDLIDPECLRPIRWESGIGWQQRA